MRRGKILFFFLSLIHSVFPHILMGSNHEIYFIFSHPLESAFRLAAPDPLLNLCVMSPPPSLPFVNTLLCEYFLGDCLMEFFVRNLT